MMICEYTDLIKSHHGLMVLQAKSLRPPDKDDPHINNIWDIKYLGTWDVLFFGKLLS